jgi:hypothetical protein
MAAPRNYREEPLFRSQKYAIQPDAELFEEILSVYGWMIVQDPTAYPVLPDTPEWRRVRTRPGLGGCPALFIYYTIVGDELCALEAVEVATEPPPVPSFFDL